MKKKYLPMIIFALVVSVHLVPGQEPKGTIDLKGVTPDQVLDIYVQMAGVTLIEDSRVHHIHRTIRAHAVGFSKSEAMKLLEQVLIQQAGIVITHLDDKTVSVTYNDALPITGSNH